MAQTKSPDGYPKTARQRAEAELFTEAARAFDWDLRYAVSSGRVIPSEWRETFKSETPPKTRVTIGLDADVVKLFRSMGKGWQTSLNLVVRAYVKARLAGLLHAPDSLEPPAGEIPERPMEVPKAETADEVMDAVRAMRQQMGLPDEDWG